MDDIFQKIVLETIAPSGRIQHRKFLEQLKETRHFTPFMRMKAENPELSWEALQYIYKLGFRPTCKCCQNLTNWSRHGRFNLYCSSSCQNKDPDKIKKQTDTFKREWKDKTQPDKKLVLNLYRTLKGETQYSISERQIKGFTSVISDTTFRREYEFLPKLSEELQRIWVNLPAKTTRGKMLMALGQIPTHKECNWCGKPQTEPKFYGWSPFCGNRCANLANQELRVNSETIRKSRLTNRERRKDPAVRKAWYEQMKQGMIRKHGVENASQKPEIRRKQMGNMPKTETFILGKREVKVQGYEKQALILLLARYKPYEIRTESEGRVPTVRYLDPTSQKERVHHPDLFIAKENRLVEVKSTFWLFGNKNRWVRSCAKARAAKELGYKYNVLLIDREGKQIPLPSNWDELSWCRIRQQLRSVR